MPQPERRFIKGRVHGPPVDIAERSNVYVREDRIVDALDGWLARPPRHRIWHR
jgi:hypothetical protein